MQQSNAIRRLDIVLNEAITKGLSDLPAGQIILEAMKLEQLPQNLMDFYELLNKAEAEATNLRSIPKITDYLKVLEGLHEVFVVNHLWSTIWGTFANHIRRGNVLIVLDALANYLDNRNSVILLEQDFIENLNDEFSKILDRVIKSDLSRDLKRLLTVRIEDILQAIHRYHIDGTEGLGKAAQSLVSDLVMTEHKIKDTDKNNPVYNNAKGWFLALLLYIAPTPYDIIGAVPDIDGFWRPKFEELVAGQKKIEQIACETPTIQGVLEKSADVFDRQPQKNITGSAELKALPASKEEDSTKDMDNP